ncbi:zinc finger HIT domain-containing protein 3 [Armigeres subalbatus]|uniref:zinc finger HIT domain-containing protein 3 n=1 Tax=Armigeres subalbatus TaxID=124917 RepID=UPI002ED31160
MEPMCAVCETNEKKYKCKTCEVPYCSLPCYKKHQESPCEPRINDRPSNDLRKSAREPLFATADTVDPEKLEQLRNSEALKNLLYNPHLRKLLEEIDSAPNGMKAIRVGMMEPLFVEFADECMKLVEPPTGTNNETT